MFGGGRLSPRVCEAVRLLAAGHTYVSAGRVMGISPRTVEKHIERAYRLYRLDETQPFEESLRLKRPLQWRVLDEARRRGDLEG